MKKSLATLLILGALIFFAYKAIPGSHFPVLSMGKEVSHRRMNHSLGALKESVDPLATLLVQANPRIKPIRVQIWHDAMASDVPREISAYGSQENTPPEGNWAFIEGENSFKKEAPKRIFEHPSLNSQINAQEEENSGNPRSHANRSSLVHGAQRRFDKNPASDLELEKRLLNAWVKTGKLPSKAESRKEKPVSFKQRRKRNGEKRRLSADPLSRAFDLARMKAHKSSRKLKRRREKLERKNHKKRSSRGRLALAKILGKGSLKAPKINKIPPNPWNQRRPPAPPEGQYISGGNPSPDEIASLRLPPRNTFSHKNGWVTDGLNYYYKNGKQEGALLNGHWIWIIPSGKKSFLYPSPEAKPITLFQGHLWIESEGESFIEQNGQALGKDELLLWRGKNPEAPKPLIRYSSDLKRMAITSNKKTTVYDLTSGQKLGRL